jgi:alcohol dehydrogenase
MRMQAAVFREMGLEPPYARSRPMDVGEVELEGPGPGEVLVRVAAAGLCHSDLSAIEGKRPRALPAVAGHEACGIVEEVGVGVTRVQPGDHVVMVFVAHCGVCSYCVSGRPYLCEVSWDARRDGTLVGGARRLSQGGKPLNHYSGISCFAEYAVTAETSIVRIDPAMPLLDAATLGCAVITGVGSVLWTAQVRTGANVAVSGLGGVGLSAVMGAHLAGAATIVAVDVQPAKLELARELGATHVVDASTADAIEAVKDITGGGVDFAFEMSGVPQSAQSCYEMTARGGAVVMAGIPAPDVTFPIPTAAHVANGRSVIGSYMGSSVPQRDIPALVTLSLAGRLPVERLRSATLALEDINEGFDRLRTGASVRDVVAFAPALAQVKGGI